MQSRGIHLNFAYFLLKSGLFRGIITYLIVSIGVGYV